MFALRATNSWSGVLIAVALALGGCGSQAAQQDGGGGAGTAGSGGRGGGGVGGGGASAGVGGGGASGGVGGDGGGGASGGGAVDGGPGGMDSGSPWVAGRVQVTQVSGPTASLVTTYGVFAPIVPCLGMAGVPSCTCTDDVVDGCARRKCYGYALGQLVTTDDLLGYGSIVADALSPTTVSLGTLTVSDGDRVLTYDPPYMRTDSLAVPWTTGQQISIAAPGKDVAGFSATVAFPSRVTFDPLFAPPVGDTVEVRWTPVEGDGFVEATSAYKWWPDAQYSFTVFRCTAPVTAGHLTLPVEGSTATFSSYRAASVRVINAVRLGGLGRTVDVVVASFDTGPITFLPAPDGGADTSADR